MVPVVFSWPRRLRWIPPELASARSRCLVTPVVVLKTLPSLNDHAMLLRLHCSWIYWLSLFETGYNLARHMILHKYTTINAKAVECDCVSDCSGLVRASLCDQLTDIIPSECIHLVAYVSAIPQTPGLGSIQ